MKKIRIMHALLLGFLTAALVGVPVANFLDVNPAATCAGLFVAPLVVKATVASILGFMPTQVNSFAFMAVQKENWVDYILGNLFKDNEFLAYCFDESESVLNGTVVHVPQAGSKPIVRKNRSQLPGIAVKRTDTDVTYALDWYTTDPTVIDNAEAKEVSFNKMESVIGEHVSTLGDTYADDLLYKWAPTAAAAIIRTTGTADAVALSNGATGTRKPLLYTHLRQAQATMNKAGISKADRYALIPEDMLTQLLSDSTINNQQLQLLTDLKEGKASRLAGFNLLTRATVIVYDNSGTPVPKDPAAATATSDNMAVLCWQKNSLAKALGTVDFFENKQDPTFYGDVYSAGVRLGGRIRRADSAGVIAIVQAP